MKRTDICCRVRTEEDIFLDTAPCAMAFRVLRVNGYDVSSEDHFSSSPGGYVKTLVLSWDYLGRLKSSYILMNLFWRNKLSGPVIF
uniref:Uncharacterized protein n=1 Tax=Quercus lobata TaxID=97700 RepID=A0A7N2LAG8_QUELO